MGNPYTEQLNKITNSGGPLAGPSRVSGSGNPYIDQITKLAITDGEDHPNDTSFSHTLGSFIDYAGNLMSYKDPEGPFGVYKRLAAGFQEVGKKSAAAPASQVSMLRNAALGQKDELPSMSQQASQIYKSISAGLASGINYFRTTPADKVLSDVASKVPNPGDMASGWLKGFVEQPISALTATTNDDGKVRPATPEEQAVSLQGVASLVAMSNTFKDLKTSFLAQTPGGEEAISALKPTVLGPTALSGGIRSGLKYVAADATAGAIAGGVQGAINGTGKDDRTTEILSSALSFLPLSIATGILGARGYVRDLGEAKGKYIEGATKSSMDELAAVNSMRVNPQDPMDVLVKNVDSISSGDDLVKAAISSKINNGTGYIVEGVSPEVGQELASSVMVSNRAKPAELTTEQANELTKNNQTVPKNTYVEHPDLYKMRPKPNSTEVKFGSVFDKAAYIAAGRSKSAPMILQDIADQTGLSEDEIKSHGKFIRQQQKTNFRQEKLIPRTQAEIDSFNQASITRGQAVINSTPEGGKVTDSNGVPYTRQGNVFVGPDNIGYPANESNTQAILGRRPSDIPFYQPFQQLDSQEFQPNFGRTDPEQAKNGIKYHYSPANGSVLITPINYTQEAIDFFKRTGYMKGEIVNNGIGDVAITGEMNGLVKGVTGNAISNGQKVSIPSNFIRRTNFSTTPEVIGKQGVKAPVINQTSYLDNLYKQFKSTYDNAPKDEAFGSTLQKFLHDNNIKPVDFTHIGSLFTRKLADDFADQSLSLDEKAARSVLISKLAEVGKNQSDNLSYYLQKQAESNGLFYTPEGSGKYRLRYQDTGRTLATIGSPEEALGVINGLRQQQGLDLDGGWTGKVPSQIGGIAGSVNQRDYTGWQKGVDLSRIGGVLSWIAPVGSMLKSVDNVTKGKTSLYPSFLRLQETLIHRKNLVESNPILKKIAASGQDILNLGSKFSSDRRSILADNIDAMSIDDIKNNFLGTRKSTITEETLAKELVNSGDVGGVRDLLYKTKVENPNAALGSQAYMTSLLDIANRDSYTPEVNKAAGLFAQLASSNKDLISGDLVLRLASALENPDLAIDAKAHARRYNITGEEQKYIDKVKDWYKQVAPVAGIDEKASFKIYLPSILNKLASGGGDLNIDPEFARELTRVGITPKSELIRDPNQLISKYFTSLVNHQSGFAEGVQKFQTDLESNYKIIKSDPTLAPMHGGFTAKMADYVKEVYGYPTPTDAINKGIKLVAANLGIKTDATNSILNMMALGSIAARPALAMRDFYNIMGSAYISFGHEFTNKFVNNAITDEYVKMMKDKNLLPDSQARAMIDPAAEDGSLLPNNKPLPVIGKSVGDLAESAFKLSGQEFAYERANASIYKTSMDLAEKYFRQLSDHQITRDEAFSKLGITNNYGPGLINQIDALLQKDAGQAADLYAQANMRLLSHVYGLHNNPIGWNSKFGRILGQWGSYSTNATQTMMDQFSRGNGKELAGKILRAGTWNGATLAAGSALGFNLTGWQTSNPLTVLPGAGPIVSTLGDIRDKYENGQFDLGSFAQHQLSGFIPYGRAAMGWVNGLDQVGQGNVLQGLGVAAGMRLQK